MEIRCFEFRVFNLSARGRLEYFVAWRTVRELMHGRATSETEHVRQSTCLLHPSLEVHCTAVLCDTSPGTTVLSCPIEPLPARILCIDNVLRN